MDLIRATCAIVVAVEVTLGLRCLACKPELTSIRFFPKLSDLTQTGKAALLDRTCWPKPDQHANRMNETQRKRNCHRWDIAIFYGESHV